MDSRKIAAIKKIVRKIEGKLKLAHLYLDDGAPASAARCYREAADLLDKWAEARNALLAEEA